MEKKTNLDEGSIPDGFDKTVWRSSEKTTNVDDTLLRMLSMMGGQEPPAHAADANEQGSRPSFRRLVGLSRPEWPALCMAVLLSILCIGFDLIAPELKKIMDNIVVYPLYSEADFFSVGIITFDISLDRAWELKRFTLYSLLIRAASAFFGILKAIIFGLVAERVVARMRLQLFHAILGQDMAFFDKTTSGELSSRLGPDAISVQMVATMGVPDLITSTIKIVLAAVMMFGQSWELSLLVMGLLPAVFVYMLPFIPTMIRLNKDYQTAVATSSNVATQSIGNVSVVRSFAAEPFTSALYGLAVGDPSTVPTSCCWWPKRGQNVYRIGVVKAVVQQCLIQGSITIAAIGIQFITWYGYVKVTESEIDFGTFGAFTTYAMIIGYNSGLFMKTFHGIFSAMGASQRIFTIIDSDPIVPSRGGDVPESGTLLGEVSFENVSFVYPSRPDAQILSSISFHIHAKSKAAFVGSSGAGKSTIFALLQRLYDVSEGRVLVNGCDVRKFDAGWLRRRIGVVQQEPVLFGFSIAENIRFGRTAGFVSEGIAEASDEDVIEAARAANAHEFITAFPDGYNTLVGERGVRLSGGQKQRIAIARTVLCNPHIMLLDEATSALDAESEHIVQDALDRLMVNRTVLIVAHRLSTVVNSDQIFMMTKDGILDSGRHEELLRRCEAYRELVQRQITGDQPVDVDLIKKDAHTVNDIDDGKLDGFEKQPETQQPSESRVSQHRRNLGPAELEKIVMMSSADVNKETKMEEEKPKTDKEQVPKPTASFVWQLARAEFYVVGAMIIGTMACCGVEAWMPILQGDAVDAVVGSGTIEWKQNEIQRLMLIILSVSAGVQVWHYTRVVVCSMAGQRIVARLRLQVFHAIFSQEMGFFDMQPSGVLTSRLTSDAWTIELAAGSSIVEVCYGSIKAGAAFIMAFRACWQLALMALGVLPAMLIVFLVPLSWLMKVNVKYNDALARSTHVSTESTGSMRTVISFGSEDFVELLYGVSVGRLGDTCCWWPRKSNSTYRYGAQKAIATRIMLQVALWVSASLVALIMWYAYNEILVGELTFGQVYSFVMFSMNIAQGLASVAGGVGGCIAAKSALQRIYEIHSRKPAIPNTGGDRPSMLQMDVCFENVYFSYPSRPDVQVLAGLSFTVPMNSTAAFVGSSGSGKSTVLALLERFYDVSDGSIRIGGCSLSKLDPSWLRCQIGIVQQEPVLFGISVRENIAYGQNAQRAFKGGESTGDEDIQKMSEIANAHTFITGFPDGYQTLVGERGILLSGGQKQRIAIARALLSEPRILLLDEATSALDAESEHLVQEAIDRAMKNRTVLLVAHRLSTVRDADQIHVMAHGKLVDSGKHHELIQRCDCYQTLVKHQIQ